MVTADIAARRRASVMAGLVRLVVLLALLSLGIGPVRLSPVTVIDALFGGGSDVAQVIVREIRLPRAILALLIGAMLGLSGAALQGLLRNPLAAPSLFGAPQSAAFGAVLVIALGLADVRSYALPVAAIWRRSRSVFALLAIAGRNAGLLILILAGLAISSLAGAGTALVMNLASNPFVVLEIAFWLLGSLEDRSFRHVMLALPFIVAGAIILLRQRNAFRALTLGEEAAQSLGVDVGRLRLLVIAASRSASAARSRWPARSASSAWSRRIWCGPWSATIRRGCWCRARWPARRCCWPPISPCGSFLRPARSRSAC